EAPVDFDYVICESTYGGKDRFERSEQKRREVLGAELRAAASRQGAVLIPSFAVERTQEILVDLIALMDTGVIPHAPVFIDSPLALKATEIFSHHAKELRNGEALAKALESPYVKPTGLPHHYRGERHVRGRPHPPSSQEQPVQAQCHHPAGRLPGHGHPRTPP
ncbi:MAG: hypothetical protein E6G87_09430, partial [Alphaproteobacteria bacterium]